MPMIVYPGWIWVNGLCILLLVHVDRSLGQRNADSVAAYRAFQWSARFTAIALVADALSRLYTYPQLDFAYGLFTFMMYFKYALIPVPSIFFLEYLVHLVGRADEKLARRSRIAGTFMAVTNALLIGVASQTQLTFWFDEAHVYHRGPMFFAQMMVLLLIAAVCEGFVLAHRGDLSPRDFKTVAALGFAPCLGALIQAFSYGAPSMLACMSYAYVITYAEILSQNLDEDHLTGAASRKRFDRLLDACIQNDHHQPFGLVMVDLDLFKEINDTYGHDTGDDALVELVLLMQRSVRTSDVVCRYGGDEFYIVMQRTNEEGLKVALRRLQDNVAASNESRARPYTLNISTGWAVYEQDSTMTREAFLSLVDERMYAEKRRHHEEYGRALR